MPENSERGDHFIQSLERGLAVIRAFGAATPQMTLSELARNTGLSRASARRSLLTLIDLGYVRSNGRQFSLTPRVLDLGYAYLSGQSLSELAQPHLERLVATVRESSSVSVLDDEDIVYISRVATSRIMTVAINVGTRLPAYATSMGRVLLARLAEPELERYFANTDLRQFTRRTVTSPQKLRTKLQNIQRQGWAIVDQELEEGLRAIAAPIRDATGQTIAAINVSSHANRNSLDSLRRTILPALLATASRIETDLHSTAPVRRTGIADVRTAF